MRKLRFVVLVWGVMWALAACAGDGAVVFAPTPRPPDMSPVRYQHPSGAFSVIAPRQWTVSEQYADTLAAVAFSAPDDSTPRLHLTAIRTTLSSDDVGNVQALLDTYQTGVRPDWVRYTEQSREAMGDGSWRMTGLRRTAGGLTEQVNTFLTFDSGLVMVAEIVLSDDFTLNDQLESALNTVEVYAENALVETPLDTLRFAVTRPYQALNVHGWHASDGVFFITGEVANYGGQTVADLPVRVVLYTSDGRAVAEAMDVVMGHGISSGGFMPFSLRFGGGQPALTDRYALFIGGEGWQNEADVGVYGADVLQVDEQSTLSDDGQLRISGTVTNTSADVFVYLPRVTVTVFDDLQRVIGAGFHDLDAVELPPNASAPFEMVLPALGGLPERYLVTAQGLP